MKSKKICIKRLLIDTLSRDWKYKGVHRKSNIRDTSLYTNLCTKITCDNTRGNYNSTRENDGNTHDKPCQLKLNDIDCLVNYNVRFSAQVGVQIGVSSIIEIGNIQ